MSVFWTWFFVVFFAAVFFGFAFVLVRLTEHNAVRQTQLDNVRQDLGVVAADVDFLFTRLADVETQLHSHSVLGSDLTLSVKDWVSDAHRTLDDVQSRLQSLKSEV